MFITEECVCVRLRTHTHIYSRLSFVVKSFTWNEEYMIQLVSGTTSIHIIYYVLAPTGQWSSGHCDKMISQCVMHSITVSVPYYSITLGLPIQIYILSEKVHPLVQKKKKKQSTVQIIDKNLLRYLLISSFKKRC